MLEVGLCFLEVPDVIRCVLRCMLEAVEGRICLLEVIRRVFRMMEAVERGLRLLEVLEVICCVLLCILEAVDGGLCLLEMSEVLEVMRRVRRCMLEAMEVGSVCWRSGDDASYATLYAGGCGGCLCLRDVLEVLQAVEGGLCSLEVLEVMRRMLCLLEVLEVIRCVLLCMLEGRLTDKIALLRSCRGC